MLIFIAVGVVQVSNVASAQMVESPNTPVNTLQRAVLKGQHARWAVEQNDQGRLSDDMPLGGLTLVLARPAEQQKAFDKFLLEQQQPGSVNFHRWLSPLEIGKKFGASPSQIETIGEWLTLRGLHVDSISNSRVRIDFSGPAAAVGSAFGTEMHFYRVSSDRRTENSPIESRTDTRIAAASDPEIPSALAGMIQSVHGLYTIRNRAYHGAGGARLRVPRRVGVAPGGSFCATSNCTAEVNYLFPADFATIYGLNPLAQQGVDGRGQTIAIIGRSRVDSTDIENFQSFAGLPAKDPTVIVPPNGVDPGPAQTVCCNPPDDQLEATLDVTRATSIAPGATIDLVVSEDSGSADGLAIATEYAVDTTPVPAQIINLSFGACELDGGQAGVNFWDSLFSQAAMEGISVFVASGDAGAAGCDAYLETPPAEQVASPNYLCSSSYATCVGGTEFADGVVPATYWSTTNSTVYESALSYIPEGGWNEPSSGNGDQTFYQAASSGGGASAYIATPSWQTGTGVPGAVGRYTPDIAFSASAHDGYFACLESAGNSCAVVNSGFFFEYFFGTSAAAPDMAGITALLNQQLGPQGNLNSRLYGLASAPSNAVFHDVTAATSGVSNCAITTPSMCNNSTPATSTLNGGLQGFLTATGYDEVTGLGSINVANLLAQWIPATTTTIVEASANAVFSGAPITLTATVASAGTSTPSGIVAFYNGTSLLQTAPLTSDVATLTTTGLVTSGTESITAVYSGDANNQGSSAAAVTETVNPATFSMSASPTTVMASSGGLATYTVAVTPQGAYTGQISFSATLSPIPAGSVTITFSPSILTPNGSPSTTTLTIQGAQAAMASGENGKQAGRALGGVWMATGLFGFLFLPLALSVAGAAPGTGGGFRAYRKKKARLTETLGKGACVVATILTLLAMATSGCGGPSAQTQAAVHPSQTYQIQITAVSTGAANSQATTGSAMVTLVVQ